jgi:hypothetical protein
MVIKWGMVRKAVVAFAAPVLVVLAGAIVQAEGHLDLVDWSATLALALAAAVTSGVAVFAVPNTQALDYEPVQHDYDAEDSGTGADAPDDPVELPEAGL